MIKYLNQILILGVETTMRKVSVWKEIFVNLIMELMPLY